MEEWLELQPHCHFCPPSFGGRTGMTSFRFGNNGRYMSDVQHRPSWSRCQNIGQGRGLMNNECSLSNPHPTPPDNAFQGNSYTALSSAPLSGRMTFESLPWNGNLVITFTERICGTGHESILLTYIPNYPEGSEVHSDGGLGYTVFEQKPLPFFQILCRDIESGAIAYIFLIQSYYKKVEYRRMK